MKLHHTKYKANYKAYILSTIESDWNGEELATDQEKISHIFERFNSEYGWMIERVGPQSAMAEWLSGLALNIEYYDHDIVDLAVRMGSIEPNPTERVKQKVVENYWVFMAAIILGMKPTV